MTDNEKLVAAFTEALNIDAAKVQDSLSYQGIPEWDSISHMVLISILEQYFEISIDTQDVIDMSSVGKAKEILAKYGFIF
ncbi:MAG TPA: acyl carrier protein [Chitinophagales bacterium]|nr:acyl carrier protein [Chitinophagales bacterium]